MVILEGILENDFGAIVFEKLEGKSLLINNIYYEYMYNLSVYFTKNVLQLKDRLAYQMIYEILELSNLLPLRALKNEKLDEDKYRYVHKTLGRFLENNPYYDTKDYSIQTFVFTYSYTFSDYYNSNGEEQFKEWQKVEDEVVHRVKEIRTILTSK